MQLSAIPVPVTYIPVQPIAQVAPVKGRDPSSDDTAQKVRAAPPPGVGTQFDIEG